MTRFSDEAWERTAALRTAIHGLPFNTELAAGSLSRQRFQTYIVQDAIYLGQFSRALAISAAKAPDTATMQSFAQSALGAIAVEQALHDRYLRIGMSAAQSLGRRRRGTPIEHGSILTPTSALARRSARSSR